MKNGLLTFLIIIVTGGCNKIPESPVFYNPLDINGDFDDIAPLALCIVSQDSGVANETEFTFDASSSVEADVPATKLYYKWDFNNDGIWETDWRAEPKIKKIFDSGAKRREIVLLVRGGKKLESQVMVSIFINTRPTAKFRWYLGPLEGNYYFDASNSSDFEDPKSISYRWDFNGDGEFDTDWSESSKILQNFKEVQVNKITLEVRDINSLSNLIDKEITSGLNTMVNVVAGDFIMGSDIDFEDVKPEHIIYLDEYKIDLCEVSNSQYAIFLNALFRNNNLQVFSDHVRQGSFKMLMLDEGLTQQIFFEHDSFRVLNNKENYPVEQVTWYGAKLYAEYYNKRLPTEAEWEKAARGTNARTYPWGEQSPNSTLANINLFFNSAKPVGSFYPNGSSVFGCLDMVGNVREWCSDWYDIDYYESSPTNNPQGGDGVYKILRSGDWGSAIFNSYSYRRLNHHPIQGSFYQIGFRCVL